jgi:hypothetical protein
VGDERVVRAVACFESIECALHHSEFYSIDSHPKKMTNRATANYEQT